MGGRLLLRAVAAAAVATSIPAAAVWAAGGGGADAPQASGFAGRVTASARPIERVLGPATSAPLHRVACKGAARTTRCWVAR